MFNDQVNVYINSKNRATILISMSEFLMIYYYYMTKTSIGL